MTGTEPESRGSRPDPEAFESWDRPRHAWLLAGDSSGARHRTLLLEMVTRVLFPTMLVFSFHLLLVGHYGPGGGFSGGLVAGLAFVLRYIAGGSAELSAVIRVRPPVLLGTGLAIAIVAGLAPTPFGRPVLSSVGWEADLPLVGTVSVQTNLFLDVGVFLLIIGVVLDLLRALGAGIERDMRDAGETP